MSKRRKIRKKVKKEIKALEKKALIASKDSEKKKMLKKIDDNIEDLEKQLEGLHQQTEVLKEQIIVPTLLHKAYEKRKDGE